MDIIDDVLTDEGFEVTASLTTEPIQNIESIEPDLLIVDDHISGSKKDPKLLQN